MSLIVLSFKARKSKMFIPFFESSFLGTIQICVLYGEKTLRYFPLTVLLPTCLFPLYEFVEICIVGY